MLNPIDLGNLFDILIEFLQRGTIYIHHNILTSARWIDTNDGEAIHGWILISLVNGPVQLV